jgi:hypothetical protein
MRVTTGRAIFENSPSTIHYVFLQTVESGSKESEHNMGSSAPWGITARNFPYYY